MNGALALGITLSPHVAARLVLYMQELLRWNARINLTALKTETEIISKHFLDSLAAFNVFEPRPGFRILDVGSGAGFPGMVLKLQAPMLALTLLEPSTKRSAFLHHIAGILGVLNTQIETRRIEDFTERGGYDLITSRALKADVLLTAAPGLLRPGGRVMLYRSEPLPSPPEGFDITRQISFTLPFTRDNRALTVLKRKNDDTPATPLPISMSC
jgi:16S rRNA (guanine527-N7)-methyltransferase